MNRRWYKVRGTSVAAVVTLALGLGAGMAIFGALYGAFWQPLPYPHASELAAVFESGRYGDMPVAAGDARDLAAGSATLAGVGVYGYDGEVLTGLGSPRQLEINLATPALFDVLGMAMARGRAFTAADMLAGAPPVAIISNAFWQQHFNGRPALGRYFQLAGVSHTVVGILPPRWAEFASSDPAILVPLTSQDAVDYGDKRYTAIARLRPGVMVAAARAEAAPVAAGIGRRHADDKFSFAFGRVAAWRYAWAGYGLVLVLGAALFLLLLACVNVSCLLLSRAHGRRHEFAIRTALGAGRGRIARGVIGEGIGLGLVGGLLGWWLAWGLRQLIMASHPAEWLARGAAASTPVPLVFGVLLSVAAGAVCSLAPAWSATRAAAGTAGLQAAQPRRLRGVVIAFEVALALVLTILTALFLRSLSTMQAPVPGFDAGHVLAARIYNPQLSPPVSNVLAEQALARAGALPGVAAVALAEPLRFGGGVRSLAQRGGGNVELGVGRVSPGFFAAMGIPRLRGRAFDANDSANAPKVAIVNQTLARSWWPAENPLGKQITLATKTVAGPWTVIGVMRDSRLGGRGTDMKPVAYFPLAQMPGSGVEYGADVVVRTRGEPAALAPTLKRALQAQMPDAVITVGPALRSGPAFTILFTLFLLAALLSLVLAIVGVYGTVSYWVSQRQQEMGVRLALRAARGRLMRLVLGRTLLWAVAGTVAGTGIAMAAARALRSILLHVEPNDPLSIAAGVGVLLTAATLAAYVPALRAARTDPVEALRHE